MANQAWRLIREGPSDGLWNMAVDEAILVTANERPAAPVLRLYSWEAPALSIGRLQKDDGRINKALLREAGIPVVRRPTGGRALLHDDEVTFSLTIPAASPHYGSLAKIYSIAAGAIEKALGGLGVELDRREESLDGRGYFSRSSCLASRTGYELSSGGAKVAAIAQRRMKNTAMQHGSILLSVDREKHLGLFHWPDEEARMEAGRLMAGLDELCGRKVARAALEDLFVQALEGTHDISFKASGLARAEQMMAMWIMEREKSFGREAF